MRIQFAIAIAAGFVMSASASAEVYRWVDDQGVIGFAEDFGRIPEKYRKRATVVGGDEETGIKPVQEPAEKPAATGAGGKGQSKPEDVRKAIKYGGKDSSYWKQEFFKAKGELQGWRDQLNAVNARLADSSQMGRSEYKSLDTSRKTLEELEAEAVKKLESLNAEADKFNVPADLR